MLIKQKKMFKRIRLNVCSVEKCVGITKMSHNNKSRQISDQLFFFNKIGKVKPAPIVIVNKKKFWHSN